MVAALARIAREHGRRPILRTYWYTTRDDDQHDDALRVLSALPYVRVRQPVTMSMSAPACPMVDIDLMIRRISDACSGRAR